MKAVGVVLRWFPCLVGCWLLAWSASVGAQPRIVVLDFDGPRANVMRTQVVRALSSQDVELVERASAVDAASKADVDLATDAGRLTVARELHISAFVDGEITKSGRQYEVMVRAYAGHDGVEVALASFEGSRKKVAKRVKRRFWRQLGEVLAAAEPPGPDPVVEEPGESELDQESMTSSGVEEGLFDEGEELEDDVSGPPGALAAFDLSLGMRFVSRSYEPNQAVLPMANYLLLPFPAFFLQLHWYPITHFSDGPLAYVGLETAFMYVLSPASERDGVTFETSASAYRFGLRGRLPLGPHELALTLGYAASMFEISNGQDGTEANLPSVKYSFLRVGPEVRVVLSDAISVEAEMAYLHPLGFGEIASGAWFPNTSGQGIDVGLRGAFRILEQLEIYGGVRFRQIGLTFEPSPMDPGAQMGRVAGGATDRYIAPEFGATLRL